jgi:hypothetical protein
MLVKIIDDFNFYLKICDTWNQGAQIPLGHMLISLSTMSFHLEIK